MAMLDPLIDSWRVYLGATITIGKTKSGAGETDFERRIIFINDCLTRPEMRCTAMHELGHLAEGPRRVGVTPEEYEDAADEWAVRRLVTPVQFEQALQIGRDDRDCAMICDIDDGTWQVARRLYDAVPAQRASSDG